MKQIAVLVVALFCSCWLNPAFAQDSADPKPWKSVELFPEGAPNEQGQEVGPEEWKPLSEGQPMITRLANVTKPTLEIYLGDGDSAKKPALILAPGGGYSILAWKHEGTMVAEYLQKKGYTTLVLKYRVPRRKDREGHEAPLEDARKALELAHANAKEWMIDPDRLGIGGFSAGGHLAAMACYAKGTQQLPKEQQADFAVLIYPAYLENEEKTGLSELLEITEESPRAFVVHAWNDRGRAGVDGSIELVRALSKSNVNTEFHVWSQGGHGFGILDRGLPINSWADRMAEWLQLEFGK